MRADLFFELNPRLELGPPSLLMKCFNILRIYQNTT